MLVVDINVESDVINRKGTFSKKTDEPIEKFTERVIACLKLYIIKAEENDKDLFSAG